MMMITISTTAMTLMMIAESSEVLVDVDLDGTCGWEEDGDRKVEEVEDVDRNEEIEDGRGVWVGVGTGGSTVTGE